MGEFISSIFAGRFPETVFRERSLVIADTAALQRVDTKTLLNRISGFARDTTPNNNPNPLASIEIRVMCIRRRRRDVLRKTLIPRWVYACRLGDWCTHTYTRVPTCVSPNRAEVPRSSYNIIVVYRLRRGSFSERVLPRKYIYILYILYYDDDDDDEHTLAVSRII